MRELIQGIVETEGEAKRMVQTAREQAERCVAAAQKRAQEVVVQSSAETRVQAEKIIESGVTQARVEMKRCLEKAAVEMKERVQLDPATREKIVRTVVRFVCGQSQTTPDDDGRRGG